MVGKGSSRVCVGMLLGAGLAVLPVAARAADAVVGEEIVVTAGRAEQDALKAPASVTVITADDLRQDAARTVVDALRKAEGVYVRSVTGGPATAEVGMRGFGENGHGRVLVLLDGQKMNRPDMASVNWMQIPLNNVERIEVVRGGQSALYGDHAVAGVINIITRRGAGEPAGYVSAEAGSFGSLAAQAGFSGKEQAVSYSVNVDRQEADGYRDRTGYTSWGAGARLGYEAGPQAGASLALTWSDVDYEIPGWLNEIQLAENRKQSTSTEDRSRKRFFNSDVIVKLGLGDAQRLEAGLSYGRQEIASDMTSWMSYNDVQIDTIGITPRYVNESPLGGRNNRFMLGVDYYLDMLDSERYSDEPRTMQSIAANVQKSTLGAHVQDSFSVTESLALGLGARVDMSEFSGDAHSMGSSVFDDSQTHQASAMDGSVMWTFAERSKAFLRGGTLYRYPFVDEQISYSGYGADQFYADLDPEQGWNIELGGQAALGRDLDVGLSLFRSDMQDEIAWNAMAQMNENLDKTVRQGIEASAIYRISGNVRLDGNYTYTDAQFDGGVNDGNRIPLVPEHKASVGVRVKLPADLVLGMAATYVGETYLGGDSGNIMPKLADYTVVDANLRYVSPAIPGLEAHVAVDNLFNEKYASLGYVGWAENGFYPSPEIGYRAGVGYSF